jgi:hypothetical protein
MSDLLIERKLEQETGMKMRISRLCVVAILVTAFLISGTAIAAKKDDPERLRVLGKVTGMLADTHDDDFKIMEFMSRLGSSRVIGERYEDLAKDLYWKKKHMRGVVLVSRMGIQHCLFTAAWASDRNEATFLRAQAKTIAYNLGSFTWPGWNGKGVKITTEQQAAGLDAAYLNLRLAEELNRDDKIVAGAYWLLGAHQLAAGKHGASKKSLLVAKGKAFKAGDQALGHASAAYIGIVQLAMKQKATGGKTYDAALAELAKIESEDAKEFLRQLPIARKVFAK